MVSSEKILNSKLLNGSDNCITGKKMFRKTKDIFKRIPSPKITTFLKTTLVVGAITTLVYQKISHGSSGTKTPALITMTFLLSVFMASISKGQHEDKIVTFIILMISILIIYISWWVLENFLGIPINNPLFVGYFTTLFFFMIPIIISRFTYLNLVKVTACEIGLLTIGVIIFFFSILSSLKICEGEDIATGDRDPLHITVSIYLTWALLVGLLFLMEIICKNNSFIDILNPKTFGGKLFWVSMLISGILLWYTWKICSDKTADKDSENKKDKPSWINNSIYLAMIATGFNLVIGHNLSSVFLAFLGFSIVDRCLPKNDPKQMPFSAIIFLNIVFIGIRDIAKII